MEHPTDSSGIREKPGFVYKLLKSMYGLNKAGNISGSLLFRTLKKWSFTESTINARVLFKTNNLEFIIPVIVVEDLILKSKSRPMIEAFKAKLASFFNIKRFGAINSSLGWEIRRSQEGIFISQSRYAKDILDRYGMSACNGT